LLILANRSTRKSAYEAPELTLSPESN
jgi:hypothetical protein